MKPGLILALCVLSLLSALLGGCASHGSGTATADPSAQRKGHWVTIPPQTGSLISQRVWVEDNGQTNASPSMNNVQNASPAAVQRIQSGSSSPRPGGS